MRIVLDTNVLLPSIRRDGESYWLFRAVVEGELTLVVSTSILLEYEEVITRRTTPSISHSVIQVLLALPNVEFVDPGFRWHLVTADPDDDKFVDAYLAGGANQLVTHDAHFDALSALDFPPVQVATVRQLRDMVSGRK